MRILIAEDEPAFRQIVQKMLAEWGYEVVVAADGAEACRILLADNAPKLAILDWKMPGMEGVEICRTLRRELPEQYTYIILLTSQQRDEDLVAGMEAGADDYMVKPFKHNELRVRLRAGRRIIELHEKLAAARAVLQEKATHDSLTGLLNRSEILRLLSQELARYDRDGICFSIIMADVDHFKQINDSYGHPAGDTVLRLTARKMQALMRPYDAIGRYGGEEFLIILPECCGECARAFAERLCCYIGSEKMDTSEGMLPVTVSLGVASSGSGVREGEQFLLKSADQALYRAKQAGRNRVEMAPEAGAPGGGAQLRGGEAPLLRGGGAPAPARSDLKTAAVPPVGAELGRRLAALEMAALEGGHREMELQEARDYAEHLMETVREPLLVLTSELKVLTANRSFHDTFRVSPQETIGNLIYDLGDRQWDIPGLRLLLEEVLPKETFISGYRVEHDFTGTGATAILCNARQVFRKDIGSQITLLALEVIGDRSPRPA